MKVQRMRQKTACSGCLRVTDCVVSVSLNDQSYPRNAFMLCRGCLENLTEMLGGWVYADDGK